MKRLSLHETKAITGGIVVDGVEIDVTFVDYRVAYGIPDEFATPAVMVPVLKVGDQYIPLDQLEIKSLS